MCGSWSQYERCAPVPANRRLAARPSAEFRMRCSSIAVVHGQASEQRLCQPFVDEGLDTDALDPVGEGGVGCDARLAIVSPLEPCRSADQYQSLDAGNAIARSGERVTCPHRIADVRTRPAESHEPGGGVLDAQPIISTESMPRHVEERHRRMVVQRLGDEVGTLVPVVVGLGEPVQEDESAIRHRRCRRRRPAPRRPRRPAFAHAHDAAR